MKRMVWGLLTVLWGTVPLAGAQAPDPAPAGIYTCVDASGRKLTADRPIVECNDREQKVLNPSGTVRTRLGPAPPAQERAAQEQQAKRDALERERQAEERRRERALLLRYPSRSVHDQERAKALGQIDTVIQVARQRLVELARQRKGLDDEMAFYKKDPSKAPAYLRSEVEGNKQSEALQQSFIEAQQAEIGRVNARFDDELARLRPLWEAAGAPP